MRFLIQTLVTVTLCLSVGFHWGVLQSVAWAGMLVTYSQDASISEAVEKTFDGNHPCHLCKIVKQGKQTEKKQETTLPGKKFDPCVPFDLARFDFQPRMVERCSIEAVFTVRSDLPSVPPPKAA